MNAAEHYKFAEELLSVMGEETEPETWEALTADGSLGILLQAAQVHATLALYREISVVTAEIHDLAVARESAKAV